MQVEIPREYVTIGEEILTGSVPPAVVEVARVGYLTLALPNSCSLGAIEVVRGILKAETERTVVYHIGKVELLAVSTGEES